MEELQVQFGTQTGEETNGLPWVVAEFVEGWALGGPYCFPGLRFSQRGGLLKSRPSPWMSGRRPIPFMSSLSL